MTREAFELALELDTEGVGWGDELHGRVVVTAGPDPVLVRAVRLELPNVSEIQTESPHQPVVFPVRRELLPRLEVPAGESRPIPFSLRAPWRVLSQEQTEVRACVKTDLGDRATDTLVWLAPPARLVRIVRVLGELTGTAIHRWRGFGAGDGVVAELKPVDYEDRAFDGVELAVFRQGQGFYGFLSLDLPERTAADHLRAAVGLDRRQLEVRFDRGDPDWLKSYLTGLLRQYRDPAWSLPLPSAAPGPSPDSLPVPAAADPPDSQTLPRPAAEPEGR